MHWVFGYGSIIWRQDFPFLMSRPALLRGWQRRFWQGSPDHRGTPARPGRVVTLVQSESAHCRGVAFQIEQERALQVLEILDDRESGGYVRLPVDVELDNGETVQALTYIAPPDNDNFLGGASDREIAEQIRVSAGVSGHNVDYVLRLAEALRRLDIEDEHVDALAIHIQSAAGGGDRYRECL